MLYPSNIRKDPVSQRTACYHVKAEVDKLITKGVIVQVARETGEFISTRFLRPNKDGTHRTTILNLKAFNAFVAYHHFKMDTLEAAVSMMKPGCLMAARDHMPSAVTPTLSSCWYCGCIFTYSGGFYNQFCMQHYWMHPLCDFLI